jgi:ubiquinone/menaquinone biosynthesis C-methylase UbiE/catechol 2,3-dioxygenase-like lactoylglutathione lyase family enzyme
VRVIRDGQARYDEVADEYVATHPDTYAHEPTATLLRVAAVSSELRVLDLACGHGLVARELARQGASVTGVDISPTLLAAARAEEERAALGIEYLLGDVADPLVLTGRHFDAVVSNFGLSDIDDLDGTLRNVARVLEPDGLFVFSILHPCFPGSEPAVSASWPRGGGYFEEGRWSSAARLSTLRNVVGSNHRSLSTYFNALAKHGLTLDRVAEPQPPSDWVATVGLHESVPTYLVVACRTATRPASLRHNRGSEPDRAASAESTEGEPVSAPKFTGVSHIELTVRDADRSAAWYERVLLMKRLDTSPDHDAPGVTARLAHVMHMPTGLTFGLIQHAAGDGGEFSEFRVGLDHLALAADSREELEKWVEHLDECAVPHSPINDTSYASVLVFRDPDNIQLELFALASDYVAPLGSDSSAP